LLAILVAMDSRFPRHESSPPMGRKAIAIHGGWGVGSTCASREALSLSPLHLALFPVV
jgi:hypothetical protein